MRPRLQVAVDNPDLVSALSALNRAEPAVDVIECGTILIIAEGLRAVREIRALYPGKTILADVRIAEAGSRISAARCRWSSARATTPNAPGPGGSWAWGTSS